VKNTGNGGKKLNSLSEKCGKSGFNANVTRMKTKDCSTILLVKIVLWEYDMVKTIIV